MRTFISVFSLCFFSSVPLLATSNSCRELLAAQFTLSRTEFPTGNRVDVLNSDGESVLSESVRGQLTTPSTRLRLYATRAHEFHTVLIVTGPPWVWLLEKSDNQNKFTLKNQLWVSLPSGPNTEIKIAISENGEYFGILYPNPDAVSRGRILTYQTRESQLVVSSHPLMESVTEFYITSTGGVQL